MGNEFKPKHVILQEFIKILYEYNPMTLPLSEMGDSGLDEYESEALSILSRFSESMIDMCDDAILQREIAVSIVVQALQFWFAVDSFQNTEKLSCALLDTYVAGCPTREQNSNSEVLSKS